MTANLPTKIELLESLKMAGEAIMEIYEKGDFSVDHKSDDSPLTQADLKANQILVDFLRENSSFPVISEEGEHYTREERKSFTSFWLVDPLDGTREFVNRNGEFTVNVALIEDGVPVMGAIYVPVTKVSYFGQLGEGAIKIQNGNEQKIVVNQGGKATVGVGSKSHAQPQEQEFYKANEVEDLRAVGSSLKFCMVAEGNADVYCRFGPTMEWDVAAGHAIVKAAGGEVYEGASTEQVFRYNKPDLKNGPFLCISKMELING